MARVFSIPLFLILFLLSMKLLTGHALAQEAEHSTGTLALWKSIGDFEDKFAFSKYGPPMKEDVKRFTGETKLYEDMAYYFDETAEDEPDFTFTVEAYDAPVSAFRPAILRPGNAEEESEDNPFGEDDPLPEDVQSTSTYVEEIRPTFLPGGPLKMRNLEDIRLSEDKNSLFSERKALPEIAAPSEAAAATLGEAGKAGPSAPAGKIDAPQGPQPGSDEETLANLKAAVRQLGLERELSGIGPNAAPSTTPPAPAPALGPVPTTPPATPLATPVAPAPVAPAPAPITLDTKPRPAVKAKAKKKPAKKKAVKKKAPSKAAPREMRGDEELPPMAPSQE